MGEPRVEGAIQLADGRSIGWAEYGVPDGRALLWFHGTPGGRRQIPPRARAAALARGVRLVALERPGVGASTPHLYGSILGWADDVGEIADRLGIERFALAGLSGGGAYVLACAHQHPDRVVAGAVLGGVAPARGDEAARGGVVELARRFAPLLGLAREPLARGLWLFVRSLHPFASTVFDLYLHTHPEGDQRVIRRPEMKAMFLDDLLSATQRQLHAPVFDLVLFTRPWGFSLRDIRVPIRFWHGDADHLVPLEHGVHQAALVPDAELIVRPGEGHLGNLDAADEIVDTLLELWPPAARPRVDPAPDAPEVPRVRDDDDRSAIEAPPARQGASSSRAR